MLGALETQRRKSLKVLWKGERIPQSRWLWDIILKTDKVGRSLPSRGNIESMGHKGNDEIPVAVEAVGSGRVRAKDL